MEFVYLAANDRLPGLVKIGHTNNVTERMTQLSSATGVIGKFECLCFCAADNAHVVEKKLHEKFASCRVDKRREFFETDWRIVATALAGLVASSKCDENNDRKHNSEETASDRCEIHAAFTVAKTSNGLFMLTSSAARYKRRELLAHSRGLSIMASACGCDSCKKLLADSNGLSKDEFNRMARTIVLSKLLQTVKLGRVESRRRRHYIDYITEIMQNTGVVDPQERAEYYAMCLQYLAHVIDVRSVYVISNVERAETILNKLRKGGFDRWLFPAMNFYVEFLQGKTSRYDSDLAKLRDFREALETWESRYGDSRLLSEASCERTNALWVSWFNMRCVMDAVGRRVDLLEIVDIWDSDKTESWLDSMQSFLQKKRKQTLNSMTAGDDVMNKSPALYFIPYRVYGGVTERLGLFADAAEALELARLATEKFSDMGVAVQKETLIKDRAWKAFIPQTGSYKGSMWLCDRTYYYFASRVEEIMKMPDGELVRVIKSRAVGAAEWRRHVVASAPVPWSCLPYASRLWRRHWESEIEYYERSKR